MALLVGIVSKLDCILAGSFSCGSVSIIGMEPPAEVGRTVEIIAVFNDTRLYPPEADETAYGANLPVIV